MSKEDYVRQLIRERGQTVKDYALEIQIPYTTLLGMLKNGLGGASVDNVIRVCKGLGIEVEDLQRVEQDIEVAPPFHVTERERLLIQRYRERVELQQAVQILLGLEGNG